MHSTVSDIFVDSALAVLVAESPHINELKNGVALSGESGKVVGRVLANNETAIGDLARLGKVNIAIVNTFCSPVKHIDGMSRDNLLVRIDSLLYRDRDQYKTELRHLLCSPESVGLLTDYKKRLVKAVQGAAMRRIVVCGLIAQGVFEHVFEVNLRDVSFGVSFRSRVESLEVDVFYVWHPSPNSRNNGVSAWELQGNSRVIGRLKEFVDS